MSIRKDKKSLTQPCWIIDYIDETGRRKRIRVKRSKTVAQRIYRQVLDKIDNINSGDSYRPIRLKDLIREYLMYSERKGHSFLTIKRVRNATDAFTRIVNEEKWISEIDFRTIEDFIRIRSSQNTPRKTRIAPISVNTELKHLKAMFSWASRVGFPNKSPISKDSLINVQLKPLRFLSNYETDILFQSINKATDIDARDLLTLYLHTGARLSELLPPKLTWNNVDLNRESIILVGKRGRRRTLPLNSKQIVILTSRRHDEHPFNFTPSQVSRKIKFYLKSVNIHDASVHTLRKTCGARLIELGVDIFRVSKWLGHSTVLVTEQHYVDILPSDYKDISQKLNEIENNFTIKLNDKVKKI